VSTRLREALDDLVTGVPAHVVGTDLAGRTWARGRRRRWRRRAAGSALVVALAALMVLTAAPLADQMRALPPAEPTAGVTDYPQAIGYQWWVRDLPDAPGPVAALVEIVDPPGRFGLFEQRRRGREWHAVSPRGHRWRLPMFADHSDPSISPDGRYLGYLTERAGPYVIHDLVTGQRVEFADFGMDLMDPGLPRYGAPIQDPSFWSPDGTRLLLNASDRDDDWSRGQVLGLDGSVTAVDPNDADEDWLGFVTGWVSDDEVLRLHWVGEDPDARESPIGEVVARTVTLDGEVRRTLTLEPVTPWRADGLSQWSGVVSPDGAHLLVIEDDRERNRLVRVFSLADGAEVDEPVWGDAHRPICPATWAGTSPAVPVYHRSAHHTTAVTAVPVDDAPPAFRDGEQIRAGLAPFVAVAPGLGVRCIMWASDALAQAPDDGLFGLHSDAAWMWPWRELHFTWFAWLWRDALAVLALLAAGIVTRRWLRRRPDVPGAVLSALRRAGRWLRPGGGGWRRMTAAGLMAVVAALVAIIAVPVAEEARTLRPGDREAAVSGHPVRVGHQWWVRDLPERPGPAAGLVDLVRENPRESTPRGWFVVSERGHRWRLPAEWDTGVNPTLSPDGRFVGYLAAREGPYVIHDLSTGEKAEFGQIGDGESGPAGQPRFVLFDQQPSHWSPAGTRVQVRGFDHSDDTTRLLVPGVDGTFTTHERWGDDVSPAHPVGWVDEDTVLLLSWTAAEEPSASLDVVVREVSLDSEVRRTLPLQPATPWHTDFLDQFAGTVSPGADRLLVLDDDRDGQQWTRIFSLRDGTELADPVWTPLHPVCQATWAGAAPAVPMQVVAEDGTYHAVTAVVDGEQARQIVVAEPRLGSRCFVWASDALAGEARGGLFGTYDAEWTWWWREIAAALLIAVALLIGLRARVVRRRRSNTP
jgi:hypothetical protein